MSKNNFSGSIREMYRPRKQTSFMFENAANMKESCSSFNISAMMEGVEKAQSHYEEDEEDESNSDDSQREKGSEKTMISKMPSQQSNNPTVDKKGKCF